MTPSRDLLHALADQHHLDRDARRRLLALAQPRLGADWAPRLGRWLGVLAALLAGLALVMAVASQWGQWSRPVRFALLQGAVLALVAVAAGHRSGRPAWALLAFIAQGGLFAYFGQTYQTGADPWQLFALWAALGLPLMLAARHDAPWTLWTLVATLAVVLAVQTHGGRIWAVTADQLGVVAAGTAALLALAALLGPWASRWHGAGRWAWRAQCTWVAVAVCTWALMLLWAPQALAGSLGLAALLAVAVAVLWRDGDGVVLALGVAAVDAWLLGAWGRLLFEGLGSGDPVGRFLLFALGAAALLAGSVQLLMRRARAMEVPA